MVEDSPQATPRVAAKGLDDLDMLDQVHADALRVLEEVGVKCDSPDIRHIFEETGLAAYDDVTGHLHVLAHLVEQALNSVPKRSRYGVPENAFGVGGTAPFVFDDDSGELIAPTFTHLVRIADIVENAETVAFMGRGVLIPNQEIKVLDTLIAHCSKPLFVSVLSEAGIARAQQINRQRGNLTVSFSLINSPLNVMQPIVEPLLSCLRKNLPVFLSSMPIAGLSAPYSMSGLLTLTHAEALFGITLAQLVNPGITCVHAGLPSIANLQKNYAVDLGLVSHNLANILMGKICQKLNLVSMHSGCTTNEGEPNHQARKDAVKGYALMKKFGFHQMRHAFGFLKELVSFSIAKLERHIDLCETTGPQQAPDVFVEPYDADGFDAICRNASNPAYMRDAHTLKNMGVSFRECADQRQ
ncbi:MAG: trimethylamine methyltransferase family protein [Desulfosarcina sp.]|jgi:trimethylamine:corrinoid methyltransferase-like protein